VSSPCPQSCEQASDTDLPITVIQPLDSLPTLLTVAESMAFARVSRTAAYGMDRLANMWPETPARNGC
jgi:hypothetical protein